MDDTAACSKQLMSKWVGEGMGSGMAVAPQFWRVALQLSGAAEQFGRMALTWHKPPLAAWYCGATHAYLECPEIGQSQHCSRHLH